MNKLYYHIIILITTITFAQEVKFEAKVNQNTYAENERFPIAFIINNDGDNFEPPKLTDFKAEGPISYKEKIDDIQIDENGNYVKKRIIQTKFVYFLTPKKQGTFTIGSASIEYQGKVYYSNKVTLNIIKAKPIPKDPNNPEFIAQEGVHLVAEISNSNPFLSQPITVTYKLFVKPNIGLSQLGLIEDPKFNGFWSLPIDIDFQNIKKTTYNGETYNMVTLRKYVLYPQKTGTISFEPLVIDLVVDIPFRRRLNPFQVINDLKRVPKTVSAGAKSITVKPLPEEGKPASFTGAVGTFDFKVKPSKTELKSGESLDLEISVSGNGNLKLFNLPKPEFPSAFEVFDPQHKEEVQTPLSGMTGKISDTYTIVPQVKGKYVVKPIEFSYFDLATKSYKTITSEAFEINVLQGKENVASNDNNSANKQKVEKYNTFQFIKLNSKFQVLAKEDFFGSSKFYMLLFAPFLIIPIIILAKKKKEAIDADVVGNKIRRNTKLAKKFLSEAKKQLGNKVPFYMAMEKAMHNFLKAKLHLETSEMSKENIQELLLAKNANSEIVSEFIALMNDCEFARYTPSSDVAMQKDYDRAVTLIADLEKQL